MKEDEEREENEENEMGEGRPVSIAYKMLMMKHPNFFSNVKHIFKSIKSKTVYPQSPNYRIIKISNNSVV